jgi:putative FmdB family regulatory protein
MPTYNYKCKTCADIKSIFQKISEDPLKYCDKCNGDLKRLISGGTGLIFKGSGFYLTDYANKQNKSIPKDEKLKTETNATSK